jgi:elongation factor P--(R)-beta-lysine ligase
MKTKPDYLPIEGQMYSLTRLFRAFSLGKSFEVVGNPITVGGRYNEANGKAYVCAAEVYLQLPAPLKAKVGDLLSVTFDKSALHEEKAQYHLESIRHFKLLVESKTSNDFVSCREYPAKLWSDFLFSVRQFFRSAEVTEVTTPSLVINPGMEPELEPFQTEWRTGQKRKLLYLPTSPELHLKQMLVAGHTDIFEIKTVFRNEELTEVHEPEFQMLEWYRAFANLDIIREDLKSLIEYLQKNVFGSSRAIEIMQFSVCELFARHLQFQLRPDTSRDDLFSLAKNLNLSPNVEFGFNDLFHLIWAAKVEPHLPLTPFILHEYPPSQAALSRLTADGWADRFELFWGGVEIANAFHELNDPVEQRTRFQRDQKLRAEYGRTPLEIDENFMAALEYGLPPSGGIALGLDRLFMVMSGLDKLRFARPFTASRNLESR